MILALVAPETGATPATGGGAQHMDLGSGGHGRIVASEAFERTAKLIDRLAYATETDEIFTAIVDEIIGGLSAQHAGAFLIDDADHRLHIVAHRDLPELTVDVFPLDLDIEVPLTDAARNGAPVWIDSRDMRDRWYPRLRGSPIAVGSSALLPMPYEGRTIGVLAVGFEGDHQFAETERSFCTLLASLAGLAAGPRLKR